MYIYSYNGKENGTDYMIMGIYWGYIGIMEKKMEATIYGFGCRV